MAEMPSFCSSSSAKASQFRLFNDWHIFSQTNSWSKCSRDVLYALAQKHSRRKASTMEKLKRICATVDFPHSLLRFFTLRIFQLALTALRTTYSRSGRYLYTDSPHRPADFWYCFCYCRLLTVAHQPMCFAVNRSVSVANKNSFFPWVFCENSLTNIEKTICDLPNCVRIIFVRKTKTLKASSASNCHRDSSENVQWNTDSVEILREESTDTCATCKANHCIKCILR